MIASFGGGWKNVVPGLAGKDTIAANHAINCQPATFNMVGQPCEANPMRLDLEEAGALVGKPAFIVNAILNPALRPVRIVAGDPVQAHREGVRTSARLYGVEIEAPADVVITNSCPMDTDVRQGFKALANTVRATRAGGVIFTCLRASEGMGALNVPSREIPLAGRHAGRRLALLPFFAG